MKPRIIYLRFRRHWFIVRGVPPEQRFIPYRTLPEAVSGLARLYRMGMVQACVWLGEPGGYSQ